MVGMVRESSRPRRGGLARAEEAQVAENKRHGLESVIN